MNHRHLLKSLGLGVIVSLRLSAVHAQQAVTVSGHVTAGGSPLARAHVRVDDVKPPIDRVTDVEGHYSFIITSSNVHGQNVKITATMNDRRIHYEPTSATLRLTGVSATEDFDLKILSGDQPFTPAVDTTTPRPGRSRGPQVNVASSDTLDLGDMAGAVDLMSALAGRFPGLSVTEPGVLGGSSSAQFRGPRSILGTSQPLVVIDGIPVLNTTITTSAQRYGAGGFDYGSPLEDLDLSTIASVRFLTGPEASARFGGRAANGVLLVTTKDGAGGPGFAISARQQITSETPGKLPDFQNQYGQGLDGNFQFFDGKGGGINDAVAQNWGPALKNQPITQASLTEAGQGDVRLWSAHPSNVSDYFATGRTLNTTVGIQSSTDIGSFRASFDHRDTRGLVPNNSLLLQNGSFNGTLSPTGGWTASAWVSGGVMTNEGSPGTGFNQTNPVAEFTQMGRQVDATALRSHLVDSSGNQISWNYAGQNNPYFASLENSNKSDRGHVTGGGSLATALAPWLDATLQSGTDYYRDTRNFTIRSGWMGGFPFFAAPAGGDFAKGGFEGDDVLDQETNSSLRLDAHRVLPNGIRWTASGGGDMQSTRQRIRSVGIDSVSDLPLAGAPDTATIPNAALWSAHARTDAAFAQTGLTFANGATAQIGLRNEWTSIAAGQHASALYPSISGSVDLVHAFPSLQSQTTLGSATVHAAWASSSSELTPFVLQTLYAGNAPNGALTPSTAGSPPIDTSLTPEKTNALEVGADLSFWRRRLDVGFTVYHEQTTGVILPVPDASLKTVEERNAGTMTNSGVEGQATIRLGNDWFGWEISGNAAHNSNSVDKLFGTTTALDVAPSQFGLHLQARTGSPLGVLVGEQLLRDPKTHALILRNGLPLPDTAAGLAPLGNAQPNWILGLRNTFRFGVLRLDVLTDGHIGGSIFSATNLMGSYSGSLASTSFRPDSGLLIPGIDIGTGAANTQHVSTQDYYHALGAVQAPWIYSASYIKVREVRLEVTLPTTAIRVLPFSNFTAALVARNVYMWAKAPNIDPETILSPYQFSGIELGQLPSTKSVGVQLTITP